jgi:serine protease AprX
VNRSRFSIVAVAVSAGALLVPAGAAVGTASPTSGPRVTAAGTAPVARLLLTVADGRAAAVERQVGALGGTVTKRLPLVSTLAVTVPPGAVARLAAAPGVLQLAPDARARVLGGGSFDGGPPSVYRKAVGADDASARAGADGSGVGVAVIDTGIANVPDLAGRVQPIVDDTGRARPCLNLSGESDCGDSYGHGTFVAGLIAGDGASSGGAVRGVAPGARLTSVKVAGRDGSTDVSTILAAIQWVVTYKDRYGIRVLNLSLGTDSSQSYRVDPLNFAVEKAWAAGLTVVVAAGNLGPNAATVTKPADDPLVVSVGAVDDRGTAGLGDDLLPNFSSRGPTLADGLSKPDLVAPGGHLLSLRAPGSTIDSLFPPANPGPYRRGSGTSMAAGTVSGAVALMLQMDPALTPDRVKFALTDTAAGAANADPNAVGAGVLSAYRAVTSAGPGLANVGVPRSNGLGRLDLSRGSVSLQSDTLLALPLDTATTAQLLLWRPTAYTASTWSDLSWRLSPFGTAAWSGTSWAEGRNWQGRNWQGRNWQGRNWQGATSYDQQDDSASYGRGGDGSASYGAWD